MSNASLETPQVSTVLLRPLRGPAPDGADPGAAPTLSEQLFALIGEEILTGAMAAGSKISEPELARRYGVSRGPLREALHRLQERRLITRSPNQGARVVELSLEGLADLFAVREALEGMAARMAATRADAAELEAIRSIVARHGRELEGHGRPGMPPMTANRDFHVRIAQASRNPMLVQLLCGELYPLLRLYRGVAQEPGERVLRAYEEHRRILDALEDRDAELAELLMRRHVAGARERRAEALAHLAARKRPRRAGAGA
jgi:DNA-binding GntR family transcriptional regulator